MVYITGDTHADFSRFTISTAKKIKKGDTLIVCGDFGFVWNGSNSENSVLKKMNKLPFTVAFIDGKHENFDLLSAYPTVEWNGGKAHQIRDKVLHLQRGELFTIENERYFVFGGGESTDHDMREKSVSWWEEEMPSADEMLYGIEQLNRAGNEVDYILTHEPSGKSSGYLSSNRKRLGGLQVYFNRMEREVSFKKWFFGSLHVDKTISSRHRAVFHDIIPVRKIEPKHFKK